LCVQESLSIGEDETDMEDKDIWTGNKIPLPDQQLIRKEMNACIRSFIDGLPADYRTVIVLSELEELKNREIAEVLDISVETVKIRLYRAKAKLKKALDCNCSFYRDNRNILLCDLKISAK
jgi:RNA polymerase sigma-70 factor (ECF subfamily)